MLELAATAEQRPQQAWDGQDGVAVGDGRQHVRGVDYLVSRQRTIWRVMAHDIHHSGQIAMMLAIQGIEAFELRALGGHIVEPPRMQQR